MILSELMEQNELFYKYQQDYFENQIEQFEIAIKFILQYSDILFEFSKKLTKLNNDFNNYMKKFQFNLLIDYIRVLFETKSLNTINLVKNLQDFTKQDLLSVLNKQKQKLIQGFRILRNIHKTTNELKKEFQSKDYYFQQFQNQQPDKEASKSFIDSLNEIYNKKLSQKKDYSAQKTELILQTNQLKQTRHKFLRQISQTQNMLQSQNNQMFSHIKDLLRKLFVFEFSSMKNQEYDTNNLIKDFEQNISFSTKMTQQIKLPSSYFFNTVITRNFQLKNYDTFQSEYNYFEILNKIISNEQMKQDDIFQFQILSQDFKDQNKLIEFFEEFNNYFFIDLQNENYEILKKEVFEKMINQIDHQNNSLLFRFIFQFQFFYNKQTLKIQYFKQNFEEYNFLQKKSLWQEAVQQIYFLQKERKIPKEIIEITLNKNYNKSLAYLDKIQSQELFQNFGEEQLNFQKILQEKNYKFDEKIIFIVQIINNKMINYTSQNFNAEQFVKIKNLLKEATYVSIDCEFTKVSNHVNDFDPQFEVYKKYKETIEDALLTELGISIFTKKDKHFETSVFNFSLFPDKHSRKKFAKAEYSCLYFLAVQDFDFKKCFQNGINFQRLDKMPKMKDLLQKVTKDNSFIQLLHNDKDDHKNNIEKKEIDFSLTKRMRLLTKDNYPTTNFYQQDLCFVKKYYDFLDNEEEHACKFDIEDPTMKNFLSCPKSQFYTNIILENKVSFHGKKKSIQLKKKSLQQQEESKKKLNSESEEKQINTYFDYFQISLLFYYLSLWNVPVIFHNGLFDYCYIYQTFYQKLPDDFEQFINSRLFNTIIDTKQIAIKNSTKLKIKKTQLRALCDVLISQFGEKNLKDKFVLPKKDSENEIVELDITQGHTHEAGYDSFITGVVYYCLEHKLGEAIQKLQNQIPQTQLGTFWLNFEFDEQYHNLYINKKMIGKSLFIKYDKKKLRNLENEEEQNLIIHLGQIGSFQVEDDQKQYTHIYYKNLQQDFNLKKFIEESNEKFKNFQFLEFEKLYKDLHPEKLK